MNGGGAGNALSGIRVLQGVKQRLLLASHQHLGIIEPGLDRRHRHAGRQQAAAKAIALDLGAQPVDALSQALKGTGTSMHTCIICPQGGRRRKKR